MDDWRVDMISATVPPFHRRLPSPCFLLLLLSSLLLPTRDLSWGQLSLLGVTVFNNKILDVDVDAHRRFKYFDTLNREHVESEILSLKVGVELNKMLCPINTCCAVVVP
jgi:hypothetical protein